MAETKTKAKESIRTNQCEFQVFLQQGKFKVTCPSGSGEWNWQVPPQTWCSDQDGSLSASVNFSGSGKLEGKYGGYQAFQAWNTDGPSGGIGIVSGSNPFDWSNGVEVRNSQGSKSGSMSGLRLQPGMDKFSIGVVISGWGYDPTTDNAGFAVEYVYEPGGQPTGEEQPPVGPQPPTGPGAPGTTLATPPFGQP